jgi:hypothetical protein
MTSKKLVLVFTLLLFAAAPLFAQAPPKTSAANPKDVDSVESILKAYYDIMTGPKGPRDWDRFYSLFAPDGGFSSPEEPRLTPQDVQKRLAPYLESHDNVVKVTSTDIQKTDTGASVTRKYTVEPIGTGPKGTGTDKLKLQFDGKRWWIQNVESLIEMTTTGPVTG